LVDVKVDCHHHKTSNFSFKSQPSSNSLMACLYPPPN